MDYFLVPLVAELFGIDLGSRSSPYRAYRRAWRRRAKGNTDETKVLLDQLKESSVPGAYGPLDQPPLSLLIQAWESGTPPAEAKRRYGRDFRAERVGP